MMACVVFVVAFFSLPFQGSLCFLASVMLFVAYVCVDESKERRLVNKTCDSNTRAS